MGAPVSPLGAQVKPQRLAQGREWMDQVIGMMSSWAMEDIVRSGASECVAFVPNA